MIKLNDWLSGYWKGYYNEYMNDDVIDVLDQEGLEIALGIKQRLAEMKVDCFSDARMTSVMVRKLGIISLLYG